MLQESTVKLLQILEWNTATESARTETGDKAFQAGTVLTKKEYLCALIVDESCDAGTGMVAVNYLGSSRDSAPRVARLRKISPHFLSLS